MKADRKTLAEILTNEIRLVAPLFQRPYVWDQERNWRPMWDAIAECAELRLQEKPRPYFMGALVLDQLPFPVGSVPPREIIDGQQRMTSLQILLAALKRRCDAERWTFLSNACVRLTENDLEFESEQTYKVWPTNTDREAFRGAMTGKGTGRLQQAAAYFDEVIIAWIAEEGVTDADRERRARALVDTLKNDLTFVVIELDNQDDGQLIFETMNSLGTPLSPSDLVKNLLFRAATLEGRDAEALYAAYWADFERDSEYWKEDLGRRGIERTRLDVFLQTFLTLWTMKTTVLIHQFRDFREIFVSGVLGDSENCLQIFAHHARLFRQFDQASSGGIPGTVKASFNAIGSSIFVPIVLGIYARVQDEGDRNAMLLHLESYLMRRTLAGYYGQGLNRYSTELLRHMNDRGWTPEVLRTVLLANDARTTVWPDDGAVHSNFERNRAYGYYAPFRLSYFLSRVEARNRTKMSEFGFANHGLTVEHILPVNWRAHWPPPTDGDTSARNYRLHKLGNLTILTQSLNSSVSNGPWSEKRKHLNDHSVLLMNSELAAREEWTDADIDRRTRELAEEFCRIWPRPETPALQ